MRYHALATDYDGTLAHHGRVGMETLAALERLLASGRRLIMVTGRELDELIDIFPQLHLFEWVVAENGALLYRPADKSVKLLAEAPPEAFVTALRGRGVDALSVGRAIVATWRPHETAALSAIRDLGLELQVIFNKDAVMVLPAGVNKASGLTAALKEMKLSSHEVVGVGDAENDHAFLHLCEFAAAVANALPALKERADMVTIGDHGDGVRELIDQLINDDLRSRDQDVVRHHLLLGTAADGNAIRIPPHGPSALIVAAARGDRVAAATAFLQQLVEKHYQFCVFDSEGSYAGLDGAVTLGSVDEVVAALADPERNVVVNLLGKSAAEKSALFITLLPRLRVQTNRPHWLLIDDARQFASDPAAAPILKDLQRSVFVTDDAKAISPAALGSKAFETKPEGVAVHVIS